MQLQKLVYIAHGWSLAIVGEPLVRDEVQAWQWGPVIPSLYKALSKYGSGVVSDAIPTRDTPVPADSKDSALIERVWVSYGKMTGPQLSAITHTNGTPWNKIRKETGGKPYETIPDHLIAEHYRQLLNERNRRTATTIR